MTGDRDKGGAVHPRVGDRCHEIGRAGPARRDAHTGFSGGARVAFRRVAGALLVTAENVTKAIAILPHRVVERHDRAAGDAEHHFDILAHECFAHHLCAGTLAGSGKGDGRSGRRDAVV